jgi:haloacetate dehalogenase
MIFEGFEPRTIAAEGTDIFCRVGGKGPPLLLLHGCPQTHMMWHKVVPELTRHFTVIAPDLRGYGRSAKPQGSPTHDNYSFRAMARDQVLVMLELGFKRFSAIGHDRGARVLHRMCLDHPAAVDKVAFLDILPTSYLYSQTNMQFATQYWEWFFFTQKGDFPETVLSAAPEAFLRYELGHLLDDGVIDTAVWDEYLNALSSYDAMHGMCEDYRAGATIDLLHDSSNADTKMGADLLLLWGKRNPIWERFAMVDVWRDYAERVEGHSIESGHYLAEEAPTEILSSVIPFLKA